jgi:hypothetical protein
MYTGGSSVSKVRRLKDKIVTYFTVLHEGQNGHRKGRKGQKINIVIPS